MLALHSQISIHSLLTRSVGGPRMDSHVPSVCKTSSLAIQWYHHPSGQSYIPRASGACLGVQP